MEADSVEVLGRAKVNLSLKVRGRRPDGYHQVTTVMQSLELADRLTMRRSPAISVHFTPGGPDGGTADPPRRPDLVEKALGIFNQTHGGTQGAAVEVVKHIPLQSGMGGGSADAAAALLGIAALTGDRLSTEQLMEMAIQLGSDVPFALTGGTAVATGRGELLAPLESPVTWWVLGISTAGLATPGVYERFDEVGGIEGPNPSALAGALEDGDLEELGGLLVNDLEPAAFDLMPGLRERKEAMTSAGVLGAVMSGSGPTVAGLCEDPSRAATAAERLDGVFERVEVTSSATRGAEVVAAAE